MNIQKSILEVLQAEIEGNGSELNQGIRRLLKSDDMISRRIAIELLHQRESLASFAGLPGVFSDDRVLLAKSLDLLLRDPLFAFFTRARSTINHDPTGESGKDENFLEKCFARDRITAFQRTLKSLPDAVLIRGMKYLAQFPGIDILLDADYLNQLSSDARKHYNEHRSEWMRRHFPPQITLIPSYRCNANCEYCFAKGLGKRFGNEMNLNRFHRLIQWLKTETPVRRIGFLGGEPTIFAHLPEMIAYLDSLGFEYYFATNALAQPSLFRCSLQGRKLIAVTIHVENEDFYTLEQKRNVLENIRMASAACKRVILRYNIVDPLRREWDFLHQAVDAADHPIISFATVFPAQDGHGQYVRPNDLRLIALKIIDFIKWLQVRCGNAHKRYIWAKPFPPCVFSREELLGILAVTEFRNICEIDRNSGTNNMCINPDFSALPCMALTTDKYVDRHWKMNWQWLLRKKADFSDRLTRIPLMPECNGCRLFALGVCQGLCYAYLQVSPTSNQAD